MRAYSSRTLSSCDGSEKVRAYSSRTLPSSDGSEKVRAYLSRTLPSSEKNYSQIKKESLAIIFAIISPIYIWPTCDYSD